MNKRKDIQDFELAAMADGSLPADRRREIEDQLHESGEARESIDAQRSAVELIRGIDAEAPRSLENSVAAMIDRSKPRRKRFVVPAFATAAVAVAAVAFVLVLQSPAPSVDSAAGLAQAGPQSPAPAAVNAKWLDASVGAVQFPDWREDFGLTSYGKRTDQIKGRTAKTVYYRDASNRSVAYTIVDGKPLTKQDQEYTVEVGGNGISRVVWTRDGHTCILVSRDLPASKLETLRD